MPITRPSEPTSGPPELPGLIAASVWIAPEIWKSVSEPTVAVDRRDDPDRQRLRLPERRPDRGHRLADLHLLAVAERQRPQRQALRIDAQQRDVGVRIVAEHPRLDAVAVRELDVDLAGAPDRLALAGRDDVRVGDDLALAVEHEPRALAALGRAAEQRDDRDHARRLGLVDLLGVEAAARSRGSRRPRRASSSSARSRASESSPPPRLQPAERERDREMTAAVSRGQHQRERRLAGPERTVRRPCMRSASSRAIASPRPAPCACSLEVKNGSKMCGMFWRLMPRPRSETSRRTCPLLAGRRNPNPGAGRRVAQRVVEQDPQHLRHALRIAIELDLLRPQVERHVGLVARRRRRELRRHLARELADVGRQTRALAALRRRTAIRCDHARAPRPCRSSGRRSRARRRGSRHLDARRRLGRRGGGASESSPPPNPQPPTASATATSAARLTTAAPARTSSCRARSARSAAVHALGQLARDREPEAAPWPAR